MQPITFHDPSAITKHPINAELYGDEPDEAFVENVRRAGIVTPLIILKNKRLVSGHRRRKAAIKAGLDSVPCVVSEVDPTDALAIEELLLDANESREKTPEQRAREYERRKHIEAERAKRRMVAGVQHNDPVDNFPQGDTGKARDKAAASVGWSGRTAEKASAVVKAIDKAEASGDPATASRLRSTLNSQSVHAAHRAATERPYSPHGIPTKKAIPKQRRTDTPTRHAPARATSFAQSPTPAIRAEPMTAAEMLICISKLVPLLKKISQTTEGTPFDAEQAIRCVNMLTYFLTGETQVYRLVRLSANPTKAEEYEAVYEAYPKKVGKAEAIKAIEKALKRTSFETLLEAVSEYARSRKGKDEQFTPHPATWFNQGRWEDDRTEWFRAEGRSTAAYRPGSGEVFDPNAGPATL